jgi:hypothetical protein
MTIEFLPLLQIMREVYALPRGMERFQQYLQTATGGTDDLALPILSFNPMAKARVVEQVEALLAMGAEDAAVGAAREAEARLRDVPGALKTGLELADDLGGGWTNRYLTDAGHRFPERIDRKRAFATALLWVSETPSLEQVRQEVLGAVYRILYRRRLGPAKTLREMLRQEAWVARFAGLPVPDAAEDVAAHRERIAPYLDTGAYPEAFACIYGDEAAVSVGYAPLGLPAWAGFTVARADAAAEPADPVAVLLTPAA